MYIITSGLNPNEDCIQHYGRKGMRWGEHIYVTPYQHIYRNTLESEAKKRGYNSYNEWASVENKRRKNRKDLMKTVKSGKKMGLIDYVGGRKDFRDHDRNIVKQQKEVANKFSKMSAKEAQSYVKNTIKEDEKAISDFAKESKKLHGERKTMDAVYDMKSELKTLKKLDKDISSGKITEAVDIGKAFIQYLDEKKIYDGTY